MQEQQSQFRLTNVIKNYKLDQLEVAKVLFPTNAAPDMALRRIMNGEGRVLLEQIELLAQYVGISVPTLYEAGCNTWIDASTDNILCLTRGVYSAHYYYDSSLLQVIITKANQTIELFKDRIAANLTMQDFIAILNSIIEGTYQYK